VAYLTTGILYVGYARTVYVNEPRSISLINYQLANNQNTKKKWMDTWNPLLAFLHEHLR